MGAHRPFWIVVAIAMAVRVVYLVQATSVPLFDQLIMDGAVYDAWAREIANGDWIGHEVFYQAPLYPYLLGVLKTFGADGLWPIRVVQALFGAFSCGLLFLTADSVFSRRAGWIAGLCLAIYPPAIFFDGLVQKAALGGLLVTLLLWCAVRASRSPTRKRWGVAGAVLGLLMMTREETLLLVPVFAGWILLHHRAEPLRERGALAGAWLVGLACVLVPVAARNAYVGGEFVLTTSQAGSNFYIGNHAGANGTYTPLRPGRSNTPLERVDARELAEIGAGRALTANEVSSYWFEKSFAWIRAHPFDWARLLLRKVKLLFNAGEVADSEDQAYYAEFVPLLRWLGSVLDLGVVLPLAAAGIWMTRSKRGETRLLLALLATLCIGVVAFYVFARYRYPIVPIAIAFGAAGIDCLLLAWKERTWGRLAVPAGLIVLVAVGTNVRAIDARTQLAMAYSNAGAALVDAGDAKAAEAQFRHSLELDDDPDTWLNLGRALAFQNRMPEAVTAIRRALAARPDDPRFLLELGRVLDAQGETQGAIDVVRKSIEVWPTDPSAWALLGSIHARRNEWPAVVEVARRAHAANPNDVSTALSLAWLLATVPDPRLRDATEAIRIADGLAQRTSNQDFRALDVLAVAYAAAGRFQEAADTAARAAQLADRNGEAGFANQIRERQKRFQAREPLVR